MPDTDYTPTDVTPDAPTHAESGPAGAAADGDKTEAELDLDLAIDDGMGPDAPDDVAGEDEAVPDLDDDPLARANAS